MPEETPPGHELLKTWLSNPENMKQDSWIPTLRLSANFTFNDNERSEFVNSIASKLPEDRRSGAVFEKEIFPHLENIANKIQNYAIKNATIKTIYDPFLRDPQSIGETFWRRALNKVDYDSSERSNIIRDACEKSTKLNGESIDTLINLLPGMNEDQKAQSLSHIFKSSSLKTQEDIEPFDRGIEHLENLENKKYFEEYLEKREEPARRRSLSFQVNAQRRATEPIQGRQSGDSSFTPHRRATDPASFFADPEHFSPLELMKKAYEAKDFTQAFIHAQHYLDTSPNLLKDSPQKWVNIDRVPGRGV